MTFSEPIQPSSFTTGQATLVGPGSVGTIGLTAVQELSETTYRLVFPAQTTAGSYALTVGPNILDFVGNPMNQNGNNVNGEPGDAFQGSVLVELPDLIIAPVAPLAPATVAPGQSFNVVYTVNNQGTAPAPGPWSDAIYISTKNTLDGTAIQLDSRDESDQTPLGAGIRSGTPARSRSRAACAGIRLPAVCHR